MTFFKSKILHCLKQRLLADEPPFLRRLFAEEEGDDNFSCADEDCEDDFSSSADNYKQYN